MFIFRGWLGSYRRGGCRCGVVNVPSMLCVNDVVNKCGGCMQEGGMQGLVEHDGCVHVCGCVGGCACTVHVHLAEEAAHIYCP
jgi:hypothetical protein